jgi:hypothetical protein
MLHKFAIKRGEWNNIFNETFFYILLHYTKLYGQGQTS